MKAEVITIKKGWEYEVREPIKKKSAICVNPKDFSDITRRLKQVMTIKELSEELGFARNSIWEWIDQGRLRSYRIGKHHRITKDAVIEFIASENSRYANTSR